MAESVGESATEDNFAPPHTIRLFSQYSPTLGECHTFSIAPTKSIIFHIIIHIILEKVQTHYIIEWLRITYDEFNLKKIQICTLAMLIFT